MRVLVVDDGPDVRGLVVPSVRLGGGEVLTADRGRAVLRSVQPHGLPDAAMLDVAAPEIGGVRMRRPFASGQLCSVVWELVPPCPPGFTVDAR